MRQEELLQRYSTALKKIGVLRLLDLPREYKEILKGTNDLKEKTRVLEEISEQYL